MIRSDSSAKWKQVLGFNDGLPPIPIAPPPYTKSPESAPPLTSTYQSRFPRDITFIRTKQHDLYLSPSSPLSSNPDNDARLAELHTHTLAPLFYATIQQETSASTVASPKPDIILHAGPSKTTSIISFATFHAATQSTEMTLCPLSSISNPASSASSRRSNDTKSTPSPIPKNFSLPSHRRFKSEKLVPTGGIFTTEKHGFYHTFPSTSVREKFEWRQSSNSNTAPFATMEGVKESVALKLVRISTAESVAVYAGVKRRAEGRRVVGLFRFLWEDEGGGLVSGGGLGEEFEILALVSLLSVLEKARRAALENTLAWGVN